MDIPIYFFLILKEKKQYNFFFRKNLPVTNKSLTRNTTITTTLMLYLTKPLVFTIIVRPNPFKNTTILPCHKKNPSHLFTVYV